MGGIDIKLEVLNQRQTPALYASALANRPAFGFAGRIFIDSDSPSTGIYRDTGSAWVQVADSGAGTTGTLQQVTTNGNTTAQGIAVSANGIGIGTTIPASNRLDIHSATGLQISINGTGTTNAGFQLQNAGVAKWRIRNFYNSAANDFSIYDETNALNRFIIGSTGYGGINIADTTGAIGGFFINNNQPYLQLVVGDASNTTNNAGIYFRGTTLNGISSASGSRFAFFGAGGGLSERWTTFANGNFAINTSTDTGEKFQVIGSVYFNTAGTNGLKLSGYQVNNFININNVLSTGNRTFQILGGVSGVGYDGLSVYDTVAAATRFEIKNNGAVISYNSLGVNGIEDSVKGGTYTPTQSNEFNCSSFTFFQFRYTRVGNICTVQGMVTFTRSSVLSSFDITLPIATTIGASEGGGVVNSTTYLANGYIASNSSNKMTVNTTSSLATGALSYFLVFTYIIQ